MVVDSTAATMAAGFSMTVLGLVIQQSNLPQQSLGAAQSEIARNQVAAQIATDAFAASDALARERFVSGQCLRSTVPIVQGMVVSSAHAGGVICSADGMTAAIAADGSLTLLARTGDPTVIGEGLR